MSVSLRKCRRAVIPDGQEKREKTHPRPLPTKGRERTSKGNVGMCRRAVIPDGQGKKDRLYSKRKSFGDRNAAAPTAILRRQE